MTGTIYALLLQQSELGAGASLWGRSAARHFGKPFDRLLAKGILCEQAPAETWATCRYCTCDYDHRLIREINGRLLAMCPWDHKADEELKPDDLRSFAINRERLVDLIRLANDLGPATNEIMPVLWRVGETEGHRSVLIALDRQSLAQPGLTTVIKASEQARDVTLLCPELPTPEAQAFRDAGITPVVLAETLGMSVAGWPVLDMAMLEPDLNRARIIVRSSAELLSIDGLELRLSRQMNKLFTALAEAVFKPDPFLSPYAIEDLMGREGRDVIRDLRSALIAEGLEKTVVAELIETRRSRGWHLKVDISDVQILA
ncbi:MAG: hypothetical protein GXP05_11175 [Alphaproteobacteria bacterium]|nr:hypothetical protein [Alphaproteobacteria bacterium]